VRCVLKSCRMVFGKIPACAQQGHGSGRMSLRLLKPLTRNDVAKLFLGRGARRLRLIEPFILSGSFATTWRSNDGWYVSLAEALDVPLATLDARLAKAEGPKCRFLTAGSNK